MANHIFNHNLNNIYFLVMITTLRFRFGNSILKAAIQYKNSKTQAKMHQFDQNLQKINEAKQKIDYETINKQSEAYIMIRQFLFQQQRPTYQINFPNQYLVPSGKWSLKEMAQLDGRIFNEDQTSKTASEEENQIMLTSYESELKQRFTKYYENVGKPKYTFSVKQEVQKIENMTPEEFEAFMFKLKN